MNTKLGPPFVFLISNRRQPTDTRRPDADLLEPREGRLLRLQGGEEPPEIRGLFGFEVDLDPAADVPDPAAVAEPLGQPEDERPEPDALDDPEGRDVDGLRRPAGRGRAPLRTSFFRSTLPVPGGFQAVDAAAVILAVEVHAPAQGDALSEPVFLLEIGLEESDAAPAAEHPADAVERARFLPGAEAHDRGERVETLRPRRGSAVCSSLMA